MGITFTLKTFLFFHEYVKLKRLAKLLCLCKTIHDTNITGDIIPTNTC